MAKHAVLGPSSASRWIQCPASIEMARKVPRQESSTYALEGTMAHTLGEIEAGQELGLIPFEEYGKLYSDWLTEMKRIYSDDWNDKSEEMNEHVMAYVELIKERMSTVAAPTVFLEQKVDTGVDQSWGTSDVVIIGADTIEIIDLKYGMGVEVDAAHNPQLMLYALGAANKFSDIVEPKTLRMTVFQPRIRHTDTWEASYDYLKSWRDEVVKPAAKLALSGLPEAPFGPGEGACRFCPAAGVCKPRAEKILAEDFGTDPTVLTPEDLSTLLQKLPDIRKFCEDVANSALHRAYSEGESIPGWKVVRSSGRRVVKDPAVAIQTLIDKGYNAEDVADFKIKSITSLEKVVGKKDLPVVLEGFITKTEGKPSLVVESDRRPAITPASEAAQDFAE